MTCLIFICEWHEKEFFFELFQRIYKFEWGPNRRCLYDENKNVMIIFAHPHSESTKQWKCAFTSPTTYIWASIRTTSIIKTVWWRWEIQKTFIVIRDADGMALDDFASGNIRSIKLAEIENATSSTNIPVKVFFTKNMIENWYIAGITNHHCDKYKIFEKSILKESIKPDCDNIPDAKSVFNSSIITEYKRLPIKQAQIMGETLDYNQARERKVKHSIKWWHLWISIFLMK